MYRVGLYTGHIYDKDCRGEAIHECCFTFITMDGAKEYSENTNFPLKMCFECFGCEASQK